MSTASPIEPAFIPIGDFGKPGFEDLPKRTAAYKLNDLGKLHLVKTPLGKVGITREERDRWRSTFRPLREAKIDRSHATKASLKARGARA